MRVLATGSVVAAAPVRGHGRARPVRISAQAPFSALPTATRPARTGREPRVVLAREPQVNEAMKKFLVWRDILCDCLDTPPLCTLRDFAEAVDLLRERGLFAGLPRSHEHGIADAADAIRHLDVLRNSMAPQAFQAHLDRHWRELFDRLDHFTPRRHNFYATVEFAGFVPLR